MVGIWFPCMIPGYVSFRSTSTACCTSLVRGSISPSLRNEVWRIEEKAMRGGVRNEISAVTWTHVRADIPYRGRIFAGRRWLLESSGASISQLEWDSFDLAFSSLELAISIRKTPYLILKVQADVISRLYSTFHDELSRCTPHPDLSAFVLHPHTHVMFNSHTWSRNHLETFEQSTLMR